MALAQAEGVLFQMAGFLPGAGIRLEVVRTLGDHWSGPGAAPPDPSREPQGIFTKELDEALLEGRIRAAIHSLKDVPTQLPPGIEYAAFLRREDPRDAFISRDGKGFFQVKAGSRIGTSSPRREAQVRAVRSDLRVVPLRGNLDTRLRKLREGELDAILVASAGLNRLGLGGEATELLDPEVMVPAPAQGVLCVTVRTGDGEWREALGAMNHEGTRACALAERAFLRTLQGGCRVPVGALAVQEGGLLSLSGVIADTGGGQTMRYLAKGPADRPEELGNGLAEKFLENGAMGILRAFGREPGPG